MKDWCSWMNSTPVKMWGENIVWIWPAFTCMLTNSVLDSCQPIVCWIHACSWYWSLCSSGWWNGNYSVRHRTEYIIMHGPGSTLHSLMILAGSWWHCWLSQRLWSSQGCQVYTWVQEDPWVHYLRYQDGFCMKGIICSWRSPDGSHKRNDVF